MKTRLLPLIVGALGLAQPASAEVRTFDFTATAYLLSIEGWYYESVQGWDGSGRQVSVGDAIAGRFSFDDTGAPWLGGQANQPFEKVIPATFEVTFQRTGLSFANPDATVRAQTWGDGDHHMTISTGGAGTEVSFASIALRNDIVPGTPFPTDPDGFSARSFTMAWDANLNLIHMNTRFGTLTEVTPVPEPATYGMLLAGLGLIGAAARRRAATGIA